MSIQNQIVTLTDENYNLKQENEKKSVALEEKEQEVQFYQAMTKAWESYEKEEAEEVKKIIDAINITTLTEEQKNTFDTFCEQWK